MDELPQDRLTRLTYGRFLKTCRKNKNCSQNKLAQNCYISRRTLVDIEAGKTPPNQAVREAFARNLSEPDLEYYPQYSIEQFPRRLAVRFQHEQEAAQYFLKGLKKQEINGLKNVFCLYRVAFNQKDVTLMIVLDEYLHTRIMNAHPDEFTRSLVERYRQDYMEFFKIWIPRLNFNITLGQQATHFKIFTAILELNQDRLSEAIDFHLSNSLNDMKLISQLLENEV